MVHKNNILSLLAGCFILSSSFNIQSREDDFKVSLLNRAQAQQNLEEIKAFLSQNSKYYESACSAYNTLLQGSDRVEENEVLVCLCRLSEKICGVMFFYPLITSRERAFNSEPNIIVLTPNLKYLVIDEKYDHQVDMQSKILSLMLQPIEKVCKNKSIKTLFVLVGYHDSKTQKIYRKCGFHSSFLDSSPFSFISSPPNIWLQKKYK